MTHLTVGCRPCGWARLLIACLAALALAPAAAEAQRPAPASSRSTNVLLQESCPADTTDHLGIVYDTAALQWTVNALDRPGPADPGFEPACLRRP